MIEPRADAHRKLLGAVEDALSAADALGYLDVGIRLAEALNALTAMSAEQIAEALPPYHAGPLDS